MNQNQSEKIGELAKALSKAQSEMTGALKASVNPHFKSRYADLAAVFEACRGALNANGIAIVQRVENDETGVAVSTTLLHSSGEWISDRCWLPVQQKTAQAYGSAISYGRRYGLSALAGVTGIDGEDDDGNAASVPAFTPPASRPLPTPAQVFNPPPDVDHVVDAAQKASGPVVPYGKNKGKSLTELSVQSLQWYLKAGLEDLQDPAKQRFLDRNTAWVESVKKEIASRT